MNTRYLIPFTALKDTLKAYTADYKNFMGGKFAVVCKFNGEEHHYHISRHYGTLFPQKPYVTSILSDCAMELLSMKVKAEIESDPTDFNKVVHDFDETRAINNIVSRLMKSEFDLPRVSDLANQKIEPCTECFDLETIDYVKFVCKLPDALVQCGNNAIVCDVNHNFRATKLENLVQKY